MKLLFQHFLYLFSFFLCPAQKNSGITCKSINPKAGVENLYYYLPPEGLLMPEKMQVVIVYQNRDNFFKQKVPITKAKNRYFFSFKAPDSTAVLIFSVVNQRKKVLRSNSLTVEKEIVTDNNNEKGYVSYLYNKKGTLFIFSDISLAKLMSGFAIYKLQLKSLSNKAIISMYETAYKHFPQLRQEDSYADYLVALYRENNDKGRSELLAYAEKLYAAKKDETKLLRAKSIYGVLEMDTLQNEIEKQILIQFPNGVLAEEKFWDNLYNQTSRTENSILSEMDEYIKRFNDSTAVVKDKFYSLIIASILGKSNEFEKLAFFEKLTQNKNKIVYTYNYEAWKFADKRLDERGNNLQFAKALSKKAIEYLDSMIKSGEKENELGEDLQAVHDMNVNTYALILFKLGQFDSSFYYQYSIYKRGKDLLDDEGYERLITYMEKVKGINITINFIEEQLLRGLNSPRVLSQLQSIYKQLNISPNNFNQLQEENIRLVKIKNMQSIKAKIGTTVANDFLLRNMSGNEISLSSYRNKVVVLDFWATWCSPCKESFPKMQELVNKYKSDTGVVFLFIDVWERKDTKKVKETVTEYMKENKYSFNVLFDENNKVVKDYKIQAIPQKFVIDKKGDIVFISDGVNYLADISLEIEAAKK